MPIPATLLLLDRSPRRETALSATARRDGAPIDIDICDLSTSGFRAASAAGLNVGDEISVGWSTGGRHEAIIVRSDATGFGCKFKHNLSISDVATASNVKNVVLIGVELATKNVQDADPTLVLPQPSIEIWSGRARAATILGGAVLTWVLVGLSCSAAYAFFR